jgi:hypothetical protein
MNLKIMGAFAALALLAACSDDKPMTTAAATSTGNTTTAAGITPGSQEDLVANVGDRVFFALDKSALTSDDKATLDRQQRSDCRQLRRAWHRGIQHRPRPASRQRRARLSGRQGRFVGPHHHHQLWQGPPGRPRLQRRRLEAEPQRDHLGQVGLGFAEPAGPPAAPLRPNGTGSATTLSRGPALIRRPSGRRFLRSRAVPAAGFGGFTATCLRVAGRVSRPPGGCRGCSPGRRA